MPVGASQAAAVPATAPWLQRLGQATTCQLFLWAVPSMSQQEAIMIGKPLTASSRCMHDIHHVVVLSADWQAVRTAAHARSVHYSMAMLAAPHPRSARASFLRPGPSLACLTSASQSAWACRTLTGKRRRLTAAPPGPPVESTCTVAVHMTSL